MKLIIGIGNPGKEYEKTRHNIGFMILDNYAKNLGVSIDKKKMNGIYQIAYVGNDKVILLKSLSYVNLSGQTLKKYVDYFDIDIDDILVISDDLNLPFLKSRLRLFGSSGGHNGLKSIEQQLQTNKFKRLRIGISNNKSIDTADYVLGKFSKVELEEIEKFLPSTVQILNDFVECDFEKVMSKYN